VARKPERDQPSSLKNCTRITPVAAVMDGGTMAAVPAKPPRSVKLEQVESAHSHTYAQSPTVPGAGPSVKKSKNVRVTLEAFGGAIVQTQYHLLSYLPVDMFPVNEFVVVPEPGHISR
jgi:hypothetical protein